MARHKVSKAQEKKLLGIIDKCNNFTNPRTPFFIISYISGLNRINYEYHNANKFYVDLLQELDKVNKPSNRNVSEDTWNGQLDVPSYDEWLYFYNMFYRQKICDSILDVILRDTKALEQLNKKEYLTETEVKEMRRLERFLKSQRQEYDRFQSVLLKYSNEGLNRASREKQQDKAIKAGLSLSDLHQRVIINQ